MSYKRPALIADCRLKQDLAERENCVINNSDPKIFWSYVNRRLSNNCGIKNIVLDNEKICDLKTITDVFNNYFCSIFTSVSTDASSIYSDQEIFDSHQGPCFDVFDFSFQDILMIIKKIPNKSSTDSDDLSYFVLKQGGETLASRLYDFFTISLRTGRIPATWKTALVSHIYKKGV